MSAPSPAPFDSASFHPLLRHLARHVPFLIALTIVGAGLGCGAALWLRSRFEPQASLFLTVGYDRRAEGAFFPNGTPFKTDDLLNRAAVRQAVQRVGAAPVDRIVDAVSSSLSVEPVISASVLRERERLRASGQDMPPLFPSEFMLRLDRGLPPDLPPEQRVRLLDAFAQALPTELRSRYFELPERFRRAVTLLGTTEYQDISPVLQNELKALAAHLVAQRVPLSHPIHRALLTFQDVQLALLQEELVRTGAARDPRLAIDRLRAQIKAGTRREPSIALEDSVITELIASLNKPGIVETKMDGSVALRAIEVRTALRRLQAERAQQQAMLEQISSGNNATDIPQLVDVTLAKYQQLLDLAAASLREFADQQPPPITISQPAALSLPRLSITYLTTIGAFFGFLTALTVILLKPIHAEPVGR